MLPGPESRQENLLLGAVVRVNPVPLVIIYYHSRPYFFQVSPGGSLIFHEKALACRYGIEDIGRYGSIAFVG
jgi:hypothetical protein